ncbi:MAG: hypothetical protein D8M57_04185 [Candidatus Scalindua sp. AMX11]|nr:MAG: hypothetical protein DWQ00_10510 [Candidatus Scalindua sp.]NOG82638.1 hypothetical protein [Planctomycetota bacterium]RZV95214.1 MAG: hypothetical protein EX341_02450 [Candidatus Scalindua sp. SCAELEC01]TDE66307.1 MAG: hypothetical protein D8M57_04185 [Candidatus Scalindua sp. AMX11]GJQ57932.1 MAG: hypothetical protein SCALA701_07330 [Candidatus Scalindua sp.]
MMKHSLIIFALIFMINYSTRAKENPVEVGSVKWGRDLDDALTKSSETGRPVFLLFQEVPGCVGCQNFGKSVLSHPLLVEAIEDLFLPVLVYNNRGGVDEVLLNRFNEPAWNYQVVRFLTGKGRDIIPRKDRIWSLGGIASRMVDALKAAKRPIPQYLESIAVENSEKNHAVSAIAVHCFWTGEMVLGRIEGVVSTEAGWIDGREVTQVVYDKEKLTLQALTQKARGAKLALKVYAPGNEAEVLNDVPTGRFDERYRKAKASDQKKQIEGWIALQELPGLTEMQKTKINAFFPLDRSKALEWLSPRQQQHLKKGEQDTAAETDKPRR